MAAASAGASSSSRAMAPHRILDPGLSTEVSSSSSSRAVGVWSVSCDGGGEEDVLDLDSPWVATDEAESTLEEAAVAAAAARISLRAEEEEGIRGNQERQEDELMALVAIYGEDLVELGKIGGLHCFQIYIRYDLHDGSQVCSKFSSANGNLKDGQCPDDVTEKGGDEPEEFSYSCNLEYLPPLILTCLLPQSYPSKDPHILQSLLNGWMGLEFLKSVRCSTLFGQSSRGRKWYINGLSGSAICLCHTSGLMVK